MVTSLRTMVSSLRTMVTSLRMMVTSLRTMVSSLEQGAVASLPVVVSSCPAKSARAVEVSFQYLYEL